MWISLTQETWSITEIRKTIKNYPKEKSFIEAYSFKVFTLSQFIFASNFYYFLSKLSK